MKGHAVCEGEILASRWQQAKVAKMVPLPGGLRNPPRAAGGIGGVLLKSLKAEFKVLLFGD